MIHTPETILARLSHYGPTRHAHLGTGMTEAERRSITPALETLVAQGKVKRVAINRIHHWALADWRRTDDELLQELANRSRKTVDGCLLWTESVRADCGPMGIVHKAFSEPLWRAIWVMKRGPLGINDVVRTTCGNAACIEYKHMTLAVRGNAIKGVKKAPLHAQRIRVAAQAAHGKITMEQAKEIRAAMELARKDRAAMKQAKVLAERFGLKPRCVMRIGQGKGWQEVAPAGMFSGLIQQERKAA